MDLNKNISQPSIKIVDLTKRYDNRISVDKLNIEIYPGEIYSLLGENGAGKTTTINMLTTLIKPSSGSFYLDNLDGLKHPEKIKGVFGVVSQDVSIYLELTAFENLYFMGQMYGIKKNELIDRIRKLLIDANLLDRANDLVGSYSGGMQRKLTIAMAMLNHPRILFMDEPTVGLDPKSRRQIWQTLKSLQEQGITILLTTHYLDEAQALSNRIGIIRLGKLVVEGSIDYLRDKIHAVTNVLIKFADKKNLENFKDLFGKFKTIHDCEILHDDLQDHIMLKLPRNTKLKDFFNSIYLFLNENNIEYTHFSSIEPNLEDVFIAITSMDEI